MSVQYRSAGVAPWAIAHDGCTSCEARTDRTASDTRHEGAMFTAGCTEQGSPSRVHRGGPSGATDRRSSEPRGAPRGRRGPEHHRAAVQCAGTLLVDPADLMQAVG